MTYKIMKIAVHGDKFGERGDAEMEITFSIDVDHKVYQYALEMISNADYEESKKWRGVGEVVIRVNANIRDHTFNLIDNRLVYSPRITFSSAPVEEWEILTMEQLEERIRKFNDDVMAAIPTATIIARKAQELRDAGFEANIRYDKNKKNWEVQIYLSQTLNGQLLDMTYCDNASPIAEGKTYTVSLEELQKIDSAWMMVKISEIAAIINEKSIRQAAKKLMLEKFGEKFVLTHLQGGEVTRYHDVKDGVVIRSKFDWEKTHAVNFSNGYELMEKVKALNVEELCTEFRYEEAMALAAEKRAAGLRKDDEKKKKERKAEKLARDKLAAQWAALKTQRRN